MGTRLYPLSGGDGDGTKVWYPLGLDMEMMMNFFYGDGFGYVAILETIKNIIF